MGNTINVKIFRPIIQVKTNSRGPRGVGVYDRKYVYGAVPGSVTLTSSYQTMISPYTLTEGGSYRLFVGGLLTRVGGASSDGTLTMQLLINDEVITTKLFTVGKDTVDYRQHISIQRFSLAIGNVVSCRMKYEGAGTTSVSELDFSLED